MKTSCSNLSDNHILILVFIVLLTTVDLRIVALANQCTKQTCSIYGQRLRKHVMSESFESEVFRCVMRCTDFPYCQSMNYKTTDQLCQLNNASRTSHIEDFGPEPGFIYMENPYAAEKIRSCFDLKVLHPSKPSGYYDVTLQDRRIKVYCDMDSYGGGWTLVVSISNQNNNHLLSTQHNCQNSSLCVPYGGDIVTATRKLPDHEIRQLAKREGTFRVRKLESNPYDVFYRIPSGQDKFDSSCAGNGCPRITVSYSPYPYVWESNSCRNNSIGYHMTKSIHYKVFDGHDDAECGSTWFSSLYSTKRILYAYTSGGGQGLYDNKNGILFVR